MSKHPDTKEEINGVIEELSKVEFGKEPRKESKEEIGPVSENHQQQSLTANKSLQSVETSPPENKPDTSKPSNLSANTTQCLSNQELVKSIPPPPPPPNVQHNIRRIAIPKPHNFIRTTDYTPLAEYYAAQSPHHPKLREIKRLEAAQAPIDLYRIANRNNNINVPPTKLTADISAMCKHATSTEVRKVISNVLVNSEKLLKKKLSDLPKHFKQLVHTFDKNPEAYLRVNAEPIFMDGYTAYEYFDDRDLAHLYYRCRYFHIDDDHRIYFQAFNPDTIGKPEYDHLKQLLVSSLEKLVFEIASEKFQIKIDDPVDHMHVVSFQLPPTSLIDTVEYLEQFLDERDEIVESRIPVFSPKLMILDSTRVTAFFIIKLRGKQMPPERKWIFDEEYSFNILTNYG